MKKGTKLQYHNESRTNLYQLWQHIKDRCGNPNCPGYKYYGGRGVTVCQEWMHSFLPFRDWAKSNNYQQGMQIDRINVNDGYSPANCRFVTHGQNQANKRSHKGSSSRFKGVCWDSSSRLWKARIRKDGVNKYITSSKSQLKAALAYDDAAHTLHGEFACLNFPERKRNKSLAA